MKKRFIKLINDEKLSKKLTSAKACTEGARDYCPVPEDYADCTTYALDSCRKEDHAACYDGADDTCSIDHTVCFGPGAEDNVG